QLRHAELHHRSPSDQGFVRRQHRKQAYRANLKKPPSTFKCDSVRKYLKMGCSNALRANDQIRQQERVNRYAGGRACPPRALTVRLIVDRCLEVHIYSCISGSEFSRNNLYMNVTVDLVFRDGSDGQPNITSFEE